MVHGASREMLRSPFRVQMGDTIHLVNVGGAFLLFGTTTMASCQLKPVNSLFILFFRKISSRNRKCSPDLIIKNRSCGTDTALQDTLCI